MATKLIHIERRPYIATPDAWVHVTSFGLAIRLWARVERRYDVCRDEEVTKPWRRWLLVRLRPKFKLELMVGG